MARTGDRPRTDASGAGGRAVSGPVWLIAEREFRAYVATASFWVALAIGPIAMALVLALVATTTKPAGPSLIQVHADDPRLASTVQAAVMEAGQMEGRRYRTRQRRAGRRAGVGVDRAGRDGGSLVQRGFPAVEGAGAGWRRARWSATRRWAAIGPAAGTRSLP